MKIKPISRKQIDRDVLNEAAKIMERELKAGREMKIPGFGKLYLSRVKWLDNDTGEFGKVNTVRFRPFKGLKEAVGDRQMLGTLGDDGTKPLNEPDEAPVHTPIGTELAMPAPVFSIIR